MTDVLGPRDLLLCYEQAMPDFDTDAFADLYAPTGEHAFGSFTPGRPRVTPALHPRDVNQVYST
jgi:hypothetical protein